MSISGQEVVEKKSAMVKAMSAFVGAHAATGLVLLSKKELLARAEAVQQANGASHDGELAIARCAARTRSTSPTLNSPTWSAPLWRRCSMRTSSSSARILRRARRRDFLKCAGLERTFRFEPAVAEWLAIHTGKSLAGAEDYHSLPFLGVTPPPARHAPAAHGAEASADAAPLECVFRDSVLRAAFIQRWIASMATARLIPMHRAAVVTGDARADGEGDGAGRRPRQTGDPIAQLDTSRMETELDANTQEKRRLHAEAERYRGLGDEGSAQMRPTCKRRSRRRTKKRFARTSPRDAADAITGVVLTKDIELHAGEFLQAGTAFAEVAALDAWEAADRSPGAQNRPGGKGTREGPRWK